MTNAELNARAAEIMGWTLFHRLESEFVYTRENGSLAITFANWNPAENIAQAMLLFHKFGGMDILVSQDGKTFQAREPFSSHRKAEWFSEFEPTVERAIIYAAIAASASPEAAERK